MPSVLFKGLAFTSFDKANILSCVMSDGARILTIPRHNPINPYTMSGIAHDAGLNVDEFKKLL